MGWEHGTDLLLGPSRELEMFGHHKCLPVQVREYVFSSVSLHASCLMLSLVTPPLGALCVIASAIPNGRTVRSFLAFC
jgi:hypothetical protein